jgi:hypothetical protein
MNDFARDDAWQRGVRDRLLAPFYAKRATGGRYVFIDKGKIASKLQRLYAVDTILQGGDGEAICVEEKIVRWPAKRGTPYTAFSLETKSCTVPGREAPGWMWYGEADYLLYVFETAAGGLDCHLIDFPKLQEWFWKCERDFPTFGPLATLNRSAGRVVPIESVRAAIPCWRFPVEEEASCPAT